MAARRTFTVKFCKKLAATLRQHLGDDDAFEVDAEVPPFPGWRGKPDIFIKRRGDRKKSVVIVEVEHWSGQDQAVTNIDQAVEWARNNQGAGVAFVHFVNHHGNVEPGSLRDAENQNLENWTYSQGLYRHAKDDMVSSTNDVLNELLSRHIGKVHSAMAFAFGPRATAPKTRAPRGEAPAAKRGRKPALRWEIRQDTDDFGKDIWVIYFEGKRQNYYMSEERARDRLEVMQSREP